MKGIRQEGSRARPQSDIEIVQSYQELASTWISNFGDSQRRATEERISALATERSQHRAVNRKRNSQ